MNNSAEYQKFRVKIGRLSALSLLFIRPRNKLSWLTGLIISLIGATIRLNSAGCIKKSQEVSNFGPYRSCRHPLYLGSFMLGLGIFILPLSIIALLIYICLFSAVYFSTIKKEEAEMSHKFKEEYLEFKQQTPALIPGLNNLNGLFDFSNFSGERYLYNREYNALLAIAIIFPLMYLRLLISLRKANP